MALKLTLQLPITFVFQVEAYLPILFIFTVLNATHFNFRQYSVVIISVVPREEEGGGLFTNHTTS